MTKIDLLARDIDRALGDEDIPTRSATAIEAVMEIHRAVPHYTECGHNHGDGDDLDDKGIVYVAEIGYACEDGLRGWWCQVCCCDDDGNQTEQCASYHQTCWPCPTVKAIADALGVAA